MIVQVGENYRITYIKHFNVDISQKEFIILC